MRPSRVPMTTLSISTTRWRQWSKAASWPMTASMRVGVAEVVAGGCGEVLDLADHVVAEVTDQAGVERREVGEVGRVEGAEDRLERGQHPPGRR